MFTLLVEDSNLTTRTMSTIVNLQTQEIPKLKYVYHHNRIRYTIKVI
jgi:hypothetical protein